MWNSMGPSLCSEDPLLQDDDQVGWETWEPSTHPLARPSPGSWHQAPEPEEDTFPNRAGAAEVPLVSLTGC